MTTAADTWDIVVALLCVVILAPLCAWRAAGALERDYLPDELPRARARMRTRHAKLDARTGAWS